MIKKAVFVILMIALALTSAGCAQDGTNDPGSQTVTATPSPVEQATVTPQATATASPGTTNSTDNPYADWTYLDPSVVAVSGEEDG